jgi:hypothetical protein
MGWHAYGGLFVFVLIILSFVPLWCCSVFEVRIQLDSVSFSHVLVRFFTAWVKKVLTEELLWLIVALVYVYLCWKPRFIRLRRESPTTSQLVGEFQSSYL